MTETEPETEVPTSAEAPSWTTLDLAVRIAKMAHERQGLNTVILDVEEAIQVTDYFVVTTGQNSRHLAALAEHVAKELKTHGLYRMGGSTLGDKNWVLLDFGDVVFHAFSAESREFYDLESLWEDCETVDWQARPTA